MNSENAFGANSIAHISIADDHSFNSAWTDSFKAFAKSNGSYDLQDRFARFAPYASIFEKSFCIIGFLRFIGAHKFVVINIMQKARELNDIWISSLAICEQ